MTSKPTNPKDAVGIRKAPVSTVSGAFVLEVQSFLDGRMWHPQVLFEVGLGMMEGARKYGRHNYRVVGVRSSVYYDATMRHINQFFSGEDIDPDSGLSHVTKALCSNAVLFDAQYQRMLRDDRPPRALALPYTGRMHDRSMSTAVGNVFTAMVCWWEGGPTSLLLEASAELHSLRAACIESAWRDDRPRYSIGGGPWMAGLNGIAGDMIDRKPDGVEPYTQVRCDAENQADR